MVDLKSVQKSSFAAQTVSALPGWRGFGHTRVWVPVQTRKQHCNSPSVSEHHGVGQIEIPANLACAKPLREVIKYRLFELIFNRLPDCYNPESYGFEPRNLPRPFECNFVGTNFTV